MLLDGKIIGGPYREELNIYSKKNRDGARRMLIKSGTEAKNIDDVSVMLLLTTLVDSRYIYLIEEDEVLARILDTYKNPTDDSRLYAVMSALRWYDVFYLERTNEKGIREVPSMTVKMYGGTYKALMFFTSEDKISADLRMQYEVKTGCLPDILKTFSETQFRDYRAVAINPFTGPLVFDVYDFRFATDDMGKSDVAMTLAMIVGVEGEDLFPAFIDGFVGYDVTCTLKNGIETEGHISGADYTAGTIIMGGGEDGTDMPIPVKNIASLKIIIPGEARSAFKDAGFGI